MTFEPLWAPWEQFRPKKGPKKEKQNQKALSETLAMPKSYFDSIWMDFDAIMAIFWIVLGGLLLSNV